jgi:hypothetical protein
MRISWLLVLLTATTVCAQDSTLDLPVEPDRWEAYRRAHAAPAKLPALPETPPVEDEPPPPIFFGEEIPLGDNQTIVYVLDYSQSMGAVSRRVDYCTTLNRWEEVLIEAAKSVNGLAASIKFDLIVFGTNKGCGVSAWKKEPIKAIDQHKRQALAWLNQFNNVMLLGGATPAGPAVIMGLQMKPGAVALLTDGYPSACGLAGYPWISHRQLIQRENTDNIRIDVFGFGVDSISYAVEFAQGVASDSGGSFYRIR